MFKTIKSELKKYMSGKMLYISIILVIVLSTIDYIATKVFIKYNPEEALELSKRSANISTQEYIVGTLVKLITGGTIFIIVTIIIAILISEDYGKGTLKYSLLATTKFKLIMSKIFTAGIINFLLVSAALISSSIIGIFAYKWDISSYYVFEIIAAYILGWLTLFGFSCLLIFVMINISKISGAIGVGIAIFMIIGVLGVILPQPLKAFIITVNFPEIVNMNLESLRQIFFTDVLYILFFSTLSVIIFRKKELFY